MCERGGGGGWGGGVEDKKYANIVEFEKNMQACILGKKNISTDATFVYECYDNFSWTRQVDYKVILIMLS